MALGALANLSAKASRTGFTLMMLDQRLHDEGHANEWTMEQVRALVLERDGIVLVRVLPRVVIFILFAADEP